MSTVLLASVAGPLLGLCVLLLGRLVCNNLEIPLEACYHFMSIDDWLNQLPW